VHKIGIIGDRFSVMGFSAAIETRIVEKPRDAIRELRRMIDERYAIIYIIEQTAELIADEIDKYRKYMIPAIITIPGIFGSTGMGLREIKKSVERAVGADILFKDRA